MSEVSTNDYYYCDTVSTVTLTGVGDSESRKAPSDAGIASASIAESL